MELTSSSFKHQMKSVENKRHQQNLINHHLPLITITENNKKNIHSKKTQSRKLQQQQQQQSSQEKHRSNVLVNTEQQQQLPAASNLAPQTSSFTNNEQLLHHNTGLVAKSPVSFPVYELALPATLLAFICFGILFILGFTIYKLLKHFCSGQKQSKRRLTKDNIYYQSVRHHKHSSAQQQQQATPTKTNTLFYRYRFNVTPKRHIGGMDDGLLDDEDVYATNIGSIITVNEESKCKKSPPPSPYVDDDEEEMRTPEAHFSSSNPNSPSFIVSIPQYSDEINSNLHNDRSALQFLHGDIHYVQPIMMSNNMRAAESDQQAASSPYNNILSDEADCDNLNRVKQQLSRDSPRHTTDSSASSPLFTACEIISGSTLGSASKFSFSPKNLKELSSSPLLPSAGLKHGNYFKFPEVDIFTPTNKAATTTTNNNNEEEEENKEVVTPIIENLHISDETLTEVYKTPLVLDEDALNTLSIPDSQQSQQLHDDNDVKSEVTKNNKNLLAEHRTRTRRVRLKSISLDSDQARLVEENIGVPVEELVGGEGSVAEGGSSSQMIRDSHGGESKLTRSNTGRARKINKFNLTINVVDQTDGIHGNVSSSRTYSTFTSDLMGKSEAVPVPPQTPKTPIQKAASLDSEPTFLPPPSHQIHAHSVPSSSISVPSTPKRQPFAATPKLKYAQKMYTTANKSYGCLRQPSMEGASASSSNNNLYFYSKCNRKLRSYDENIAGLSNVSTDKGEGKIEEMDDRDLSNSSGNNFKPGNAMCSLQVTKFNTLNVSNTNLKTLPESEKLNDFSDPMEGITPKTEAIPASTSSSSVVAAATATGQQKNKCSILQRRGSNHSLTLQIDGSISNLARGLSLSNYSLGAMQGSSYNLNSSNYNIATSSQACQSGATNAMEAQKMHSHTIQQQQCNQQRTQQRKLLQRRGSNCSLTLNIKDSNCNLNRFNSQHSLNINKRALSISNCNLNRRNFTASLNNVVDRAKIVHLQSNEQSSIHTDHDETRSDVMMMQENPNSTKDTRKFLSSENLHHFTVWQKYNENQTPYGSIDDFQRTTVIKDIDIDSEYADDSMHHDAVGNSNMELTARNISTKPLSPQSTSEDFKIYLANIQFLQNASRSLNEKQLQSLNELFQKSYNSKAKDDDPVLCGGGNIFLTKEDKDKEEDQKNALTSLHQEFWDLPTNYQEKPMVFGSQAKNRYKTILPNEHSRVRIDPEPKFTQETYINANYIKGPDYSHNCYIATQGPMSNTIYDFWLMVYQNMKKGGDTLSNQDTKIAMLTDFIENNKNKCSHYFPKELNDSVAFCNVNGKEENQLILANVESILSEVSARKEGNCEENDSYFRPSFNYFLIRNVDIRCKNGYSIRKLKIIYSYVNCDDTREIIEFPVFHYWFPDWPDHRSPEDIDGLLDMSLDLLYGDCYIDFPSPSREMPPDPGPSFKPHLVIHCSAGIGRTGCLIAILNGLQQIKQTLGAVEQEDAAEAANLDTTNLAVDILQIVCNLRIQRGGMVQNSEQYELIHRAICLYHQRLNLELENHLSTQL